MFWNFLMYVLELPSLLDALFFYFVLKHVTFLNLDLRILKIAWSRSLTYVL